jgi:hypothetical protein
MELVPILSTIILVGTAATFLLAVFAYIMYKWRERQVREEEAERLAAGEREPHVLVAPRPEYVERNRPAYMERPEAPVETTPPAGRESRLHSGARESLFWEYTDEGFVPVRSRGAAGRDEPEEARTVRNGGSAWI